MAPAAAYRALRRAAVRVGMVTVGLLVVVTPGSSEQLGTRHGGLSRSSTTAANSGNDQHQFVSSTQNTSNRSARTIPASTTHRPTTSRRCATYPPGAPHSHPAGESHGTNECPAKAHA